MTTSNGMDNSYLHFHGELKDFLRRPHEGGTIVYTVTRRASIKDVIEALGPPHTEIGRILVHSSEVAFTHLLQPEEKVDIYPLQPPVDTCKTTLLRPVPYPRDRFVADVNVGKLATLLRLLGYDTAYDPGWRDQTIASAAEGERRIVLTRDRRLLKRSAVVWGHLVRAAEPSGQLREVVRFFGLEKPHAPFSRCLRCNAVLEPVAKQDVLHRLEPKTKKYYHAFHRCPTCDRIYWAGSHHDQMKKWLKVADPPPR